MRIAPILILACALAASACAASEVNLDVSTPAIARIKQAQAERAAKIQEYKDFGFIGEGRDGFLAVRTLQGVKLGDKKAAGDVVAAENEDRRALYREIANANGLKESDGNQVMAAAAKKLRKDAAPGHYVQRASDGAWVKARDANE